MSLFPSGSSVRIVHGKPWKGTITMRGIARAYRAGLLTIERTFAPGGRYDSLGDQKLAGDHGIIEVVEGGWVLRRAYFRRDGRLIGELYNVQTPVVFKPGVVEYTDLEVDVIRRADGSVEIVDEDDLAQAVAIGGIMPELADTALTIAGRLAEVLRSGGDWRSADLLFRDQVLAAPEG
jgi:hypothetical protein